MRLYTLLLVTAAALHARAATIPVPATEKKLIDIVPEDSVKTSEYISSEQELIDQANTIKDVENKLRAKPEDIPVEVIVEHAQTALKSNDGKDENQEINRAGPDLRNPGPPQRQEHETQNPEYYANEQQAVLNFKKSLNDGQNILRQEFQGITDGVQNILGGNVQIPALQQSIQTLREGFSAQINKLNDTIQKYITTDSSGIIQPAVEQTKASFNQIEKGLITLRNDFNRGVNNFADGVELVALLKAENEKPIESNPSPASTVAPSSSSPPSITGNPIIASWQNFQNFIQERFENMTHAVGNFTANQSMNLNNLLNPTSSTTAVPPGVQSDAQVPAVAPAAPSVTNIWQNFLNSFNLNGFQSPTLPPQIAEIGQSIQNFWVRPTTETAAPQGTQPAQPTVSTQPAPVTQATYAAKPSNTETSNKPETQADPAQPAAAAQAAAVTPVGPIRQILQNNPISKGIADAVQRLQNLNNPDKPREVEKVGEQNTEEVKKQDEDKSDSESKKGGYYYNGGGGANTGNNNDSSNSSDRIEENETVKQEEKLPEVQKPKEDELKEHKTEEVVDKTEISP